MLRKLFPLSVLPLAIAACSHVENPQVRMPADFANAETVSYEISGINGRRESRYSAGSYIGSANWTSSRSGWAPGMRTFRSTVFATVEAEGRPVLSAKCEADEKVIAKEIGGVDVAFPLEEIGLHCTFKEAGTPVEGALLLRKDEGRGPMGAAAFGRDGLVRFGAKTWKIDSIHHLATAKIGVPAPIGYTISRGSETMAVVDQTGMKADVIMRETLDATERQRVMLTAVILSTYVDPRDF